MEDHPKERRVSIRAIHIATVLLVLLWAGSWALSYVPMGRASIAVAMTIALAKALVVVLVFMELRTERFSIHATAIAAAALVSVLIALVVLDIETRDEPPLRAPEVEYWRSP